MCCYFLLLQPHVSPSNESLSRLELPQSHHQAQKASEITSSLSSDLALSDLTAQSSLSSTYSPGAMVHFTDSREVRRQHPKRKKKQRPSKGHRVSFKVEAAPKGVFSQITETGMCSNVPLLGIPTVYPLDGPPAHVAELNRHYPALNQVFPDYKRSVHGKSDVDMLVTNHFTNPKPICGAAVPLLRITDLDKTPTSHSHHSRPLDSFPPFTLTPTGDQPSVPFLLHLTPHEDAVRPDERIAGHSQTERALPNLNQMPPEAFTVTQAGRTFARHPSKPLPLLFLPPQQVPLSSKSYFPDFPPPPPSIPLPSLHPPPLLLPTPPPPPPPLPPPPQCNFPQQPKVHHASPVSLPLLQLEDPLSQIHREGTLLLKLPVDETGFRGPPQMFEFHFQNSHSVAPHSPSATLRHRHARGVGHGAAAALPKPSRDGNDSSGFADESSGACMSERSGKVEARRRRTQKPSSKDGYV